MTLAIEDLLKRLDSRRIKIFGYSVGGAIAWTIAQRGIIDITHLALADVYTNPQKKTLIQKFGDTLIDFGYEFMEWRMSPTRDRPRSPSRLSPLKRVREKLRSPRFWEIGRRIQITPSEFSKTHPVLALWGRSDRVVSVAEFNKSVNDDSDLTFKIFPGAHFWLYWQTKTFRRELTSFLNTV